MPFSIPLTRFLANSMFPSSLWVRNSFSPSGSKSGYCSFTRVITRIAEFLYPLEP